MCLHVHVSLATQTKTRSRADLIVGAPFYYDREAGGAVYVYSNPPDGGLTASTPYVKLVGKPESR